MLRAKNLHNTSDIAVTNQAGLRDTVKYEPRYLCEREEDGQYNDLTKPTMGNASVNPNDPLNNTDFTLSNPGARFGRNIPLSEVDPTRDGDILDPSPRLVSNRLLARQTKSDGKDDFKPAAILNLLAAAWIQFQTHDWFNHGNPRPIDDDPFDVPIPPGDSWPDRQDDGAPHPARPDPQAQRRCRADDLRQRRDPLVGRFANLRRQSDGRRQISHLEGRQAQRRSDHQDDSDRRGRRRNHRADAELVARA